MSVNSDDIAEFEAEIPLDKLPLDAWHRARGGRMVAFAGYDMPIQYEGIMAEHAWTREHAGLFDVSHMGQLTFSGEGVDDALETLLPSDIKGLKPFRQRYSMLLNEEGGILDDLMFFKESDDSLFVIVNGACKVADIAHITARIGQRCTVQPLPDRALLALQGPQAATVMARLAPGIEQLVFMTGGNVAVAGADCFVTRSGYTGEDGFEISVPAGEAEALARALLAQPEVAPIGLGARNSLRLEAGLCLYGNDLDTSTTPSEAGLNWAIQKVRRTGGARAGGFPGAEKVLAQIDDPTLLKRKRVGLIATERVPVREPAVLENMDGQQVGQVTSGLLSPTLNQPIAMAYVSPDYAAPGTELFAMVRGKPVPMQVGAMPFVPARYFRG